jgi:hypothetical protein
MKRDQMVDIKHIICRDVARKRQPISIRINLVNDLHMSNFAGI